MLSIFGLIIFGLFLLGLGGEVLLRGAVGLATVWRLTPAVIGLTVVAAGTSVPELAVSGIAAFQNKSEIAVSNVVGSNIFNITVIIGICALIRPLKIAGNAIKLEYPVLALVTLLCLVIAQDGLINRLDAVLCIAIYICFTAYTVGLVRSQVSAAEAQDLHAEVKGLSPNHNTPKLWVCALLVLIGVGLLAGGAQSTVSGAVELARTLGWSERIIGLTIVSAGTGLPEVVASLVSSLRGRSDIAIGNVIGSNLFNILCILGVTALLSPLPVEANMLNSDCWWMLAVTLLLFPIMYTGLRVSHREGYLLLLIYTIYLASLLIRK